MATDNDFTTTPRRLTKISKSTEMRKTPGSGDGRPREDQLREALIQIARLAGSLVDEGQGDHSGHEHRIAPDGTITCVPKILPRRFLESAARTAQKINPANTPYMGAVANMAAPFSTQPMFIAALTTKYWGPTPRRLTVSFMEPASAQLRAKILEHMNAWSKTTGIRFVETNEVGEVRISRETEGYWSYLGTDILHIPEHRPTMSLQGFTMMTPESEYKRVVRHEAGHTLGFPHEHMRRELVARIDPEKAYEHFFRHYGWDRQTVDEQVLTPLDDKSIMRTPPDQTSIMCYQMPGSITRDGKPIPGGLDINETDYAFAGEIYPKLYTSADMPEEEQVSTRTVVASAEDFLTDPLTLA